jgi:hypothetical protein
MRLPLPSPSIYLRLPGLPGPKSASGQRRGSQDVRPNKAEATGTIEQDARNSAIAASVFTSVPAQRLYEAVRDVRGFSRWAPGGRRVEVIRGLDEQGMLSEWEVSFLSLHKLIWSVL